VFYNIDKNGKATSGPLQYKCLNVSKESDFFSVSGKSVSGSWERPVFKYEVIAIASGTTTSIYDSKKKYQLGTGSF